MPDLQKLYRQQTAKVEKMRSILLKAEEEKRDATEGEILEFNGLDEESRKLKEQIEREVRVLTLERESRDLQVKHRISYDDDDGQNRSGDIPGAPGEERETPNFENIGEFFAAIATNRSDSRLAPYNYHPAPQRRVAGRGGEKRTTMVAGTGSLGGFMIPTQFWADVLTISPQQSVIRPGATVLPAGDPPDAELEIPSLDQGSASNIYGGVVVYRQGEAVSITESNLATRKISMLPKEIKGYIRISNKLMNNWGAASIFIQNQLQMAAIGAQDYDFYRGSGVQRSLGMLNANCRVNYSRNTASSILYADVVGMFARGKLGGSPVWIASQTDIPQLANIRDTGNNNLWIQNSAQGVPNRMLGFDLIFNERSPSLGTAGDLSLVDRSYYLIKDGSGPRVDVSTDFLFDSDETCFRIVWMVDGKPWLNEPIPLEGSTSDTVSPIVVLN